MNNDNQMPENLSKKGEDAYRVIMAVLTECDALYTGGCKTFYSPTEWAERGEKYCLNAELIVVFDGGAVAHFFSGSYADSVYLMDKMDSALAEAGFYAELGTSWYAGIYLQ